MEAREETIRLVVTDSNPETTKCIDISISQCVRVCVRISSVHIVSFEQTATVDIMDGITAHEITNTSSFIPVQSNTKGRSNIFINTHSNKLQRQLRPVKVICGCARQWAFFFFICFLSFWTFPILWICSWVMTENTE